MRVTHKHGAFESVILLAAAGYVAWKYWPQISAIVSPTTPVATGATTATAANAVPNSSGTVVSTTPPADTTPAPPAPPPYTPPTPLTGIRQITTPGQTYGPPGSETLYVVETIGTGPMLCVMHSGSALTDCMTYVPIGSRIRDTRTGDSWVQDY